MTLPKAPAKCPICARPATTEHRPFCSRRCADVDLHRWLGGVYAVPGEAVPQGVEEGGAGEPEDDR